MPTGRPQPATLDLGLSRALRISQAAAGVRPESGIPLEDLLSRVRARFPGLAVLDETTYVELSEALAEAGFPLDWDTERRRFFPKAEEGRSSRLALSSSVLTSTSSLYAAAQGRIAQRVHIIDATGEAWEALYTLEQQPHGSLKITGCSLLKSGQAV